MGKGGKGKGGSAEFHGPVENRVYVGNLPYSVTWRELKDHMRAAGEVAFCDVMTEGSGRSRGCGLVAYKSQEDAARAVEELHDSELEGRSIFVREDREPTGGGGGGNSKQDCRVYVGNLAWSCTWKDLKDHFRTCGEVTRADVVCEGHVEGGRSKGYGIVEFKTPEEAQQAVEEMTDSEIQGRRIFVREDRENDRPLQGGKGKGGKGGYDKGYGKGDDYYSKGKGYDKGKSYDKGKGKGKSSKGYGKSYGADYDEYYEDYDGGYAQQTQFTKVFVGNLPYELHAGDLKDHMCEVGTVEHVEIMTDSPERGGRSKGCAVVEFQTYGAAQRAIQRLHDSEINGRLILVREYRDGVKGSGKGGSTAYAGESRPPMRQFKVLVTGFSPETTWRVLKDHMRTAGDVAHVAITEEGGVVSYSAASLAKRAVERMTGSTLDGEVLTVTEM